MPKIKKMLIYKIELMKNPPHRQNPHEFQADYYISKALWTLRELCAELQSGSYRDQSLERAKK